MSACREMLGGVDDSYFTMCSFSYSPLMVWSESTPMSRSADITRYYRSHTWTLACFSCTFWFKLLIKQWLDNNSLTFFVARAGEWLDFVFTCFPSPLLSFFALASDGAAGSGPVPSGVHDEVLPRDQRERGDEEDHRTLRSYWQAAG